MTARSDRHWDLLGCEGDPVPATEHEVQGIADDMRSRATDASDMHDTLRRLADLDGWRGEAAKTFADKADDVLGDLDKVEDRYTRVADALDGWATAVGAARTATGQAVTAAEDADERRRKHPAHNGVTEPTPQEKDDDDKHQTAVTDLGNARKALQSAMGDLDDAADDAKNAINDAADVWDDGWWGDFKGWVRRHADAIDFFVTVIEVIGVIAAVAITICAIVATAPFWLVAGAFALGVLLLVGHGMLLAADTGKASWADIGWDVLNLATLGLGAGLTSAAGKGLARLLPMVATRVGNSTRVAALARLTSGVETQYNNALRILNPNNNLARWTARLASAAAKEGDDAKAAVRALANINPSTLSRLVTQDRELAQILAATRQVAPRIGTEVEDALLKATRLKAYGAHLANNVGTAVTGIKDLPDLPENIRDIIDFVKDPQWTTQPTG